MNILAIIPARGGSRGIPHKNIRSFGGRPLIAHTIAVAKQSRSITRIVVSTDSESIARVARKYGADVPFLRPPELAGDESKVSDAIIHLLTKLKEAGHYEPEYIVLLQPTSPLRTAADIDGAVAVLFKRQAKAVVSVCPTEPLVFTKDRNDLLRVVSSTEFLKSSNRQALPPTYKLDGSMIYAIRTKTFLKERTFLPRGTIGYVIERWRAIDLDEPQDFVVGELVYRHRKKIERALTNFQ